MQSLGVVDRLYPQIISGEKTATIRWHEQHIVHGPMVFICDDDPDKTVHVTVFRCTYMPLSQAALFLGKADIWPDAIMLAGMREHYPKIKLSSVVQVIEYTLPNAI